MASTPSERTKQKTERKTARTSEKAQTKPKDSVKKKPPRKTKPTLNIDWKALKKLKLVAIAYSQVEREWFETDEAYEAEVEVEDRAKDILKQLDRLNIPAKGYPSDPYFVTNLLVDDPTLVLNLVDTLKGKDVLGTSVPAALELTNIPYTGTGMQGLVIGNNRDLVKQLLFANEIPTPDFQVIRRAGTKIREDLRLPVICKLNQSGGSVGIDNNAVKETCEEAQERTDELLKTYHIPVVVEQFIDGPEVQVIVIDDSRKKHVFMARKRFTWKPDGEHEFTSFESYSHEASGYGYKFEPMDDGALKSRIERDAAKAFTVLRYKDYAKFDIRVDQETHIPYITDANPNTAIGPDPELPLTDILALHGISFDEFMLSLLSKHAKKIR